MAFPYRILQSPMAGCTDLPYRRIARSFGCEIAYCEMVKDRPVVIGNEKTRELLATAEWDRPLGVQLVGREPQTMAEAARKLEGIGAVVIDVNLGCPVPKVVEEGCGAALLKEPGQVARIVSAMTHAVRIPVTVKMRTGFDEGDEERFLRIPALAESAGAAAVTVHGRTRRQRFSGMSNYQAIAAVKARVSIPVIGNGDIRSADDAARMIRETGCDGVMVARGALGNPWIYREIRNYLSTGTTPDPPGPRERAAVVREHFAVIRRFYGDPESLRRVRRVLHWYLKGAPGCRELRERANRVATMEDFDAIVQAYASEARGENVPFPSRGETG